MFKLFNFHNKSNENDYITESKYTIASAIEKKLREHPEKFSFSWSKRQTLDNSASDGDNILIFHDGTILSLMRSDNHVNKTEIKKLLKVIYERDVKTIIDSFN